MAKRPFNGSPTVDGYYTTFDSSEVHRVDDSGSDDQGGGGGSSDFTSAHVTINNPGLCGMNIAIADANEVHGALARNESYWVGDYIVPLYEGLNVIACEKLDDDTMPTINVTGNATYIGGNFGGTLFIRGDCTITATR